MAFPPKELSFLWDEIRMHELDLGDDNSKEPLVVSQIRVVGSRAPLLRPVTAAATFNVRLLVRLVVLRPVVRRA